MPSQPTAAQIVCGPERQERGWGSRVSWAGTRGRRCRLWPCPFSETPWCPPAGAGACVPGGQSEEGVCPCFLPRPSEWTQMLRAGSSLAPWHEGVSMWWPFLVVIRCWLLSPHHRAKAMASRCPHYLGCARVSTLSGAEGHEEVSLPPAPLPRLGLLTRDKDKAISDSWDRCI